MRIPPDLIKGDGLLAVKRYMNKTAHMVIFKVLVTDAALGKRGEYIALPGRPVSPARRQSRRQSSTTTVTII